MLGVFRQRPWADITDIVLNAEAEKLSKVLAQDDEEKFADLVEGDLVAKYPSVEKHIEDERSPWMLGGSPIKTCVDFITANGIANPQKITEKDLEILRERHNVPKAVTMPNGRRFIPQERDDGCVLIQGSILVDVNDLIGCNLETVLDHFSENLTGSPLLMDFSYNVVGAKDGDIRLLITGDASEIIEVTYGDDYLAQAETPKP